MQSLQLSGETAQKGEAETEAKLLARATHLLPSPEFLVKSRCLTDRLLSIPVEWRNLGTRDTKVENVGTIFTL